MNETLTLPQLISRLAALADCSPATARKFIHDLFSEIEQSLIEGKSITIDGIGEFAPGLDAANPVLFRPDQSLATALNEPFEAFSAVELPTGFKDNLADNQGSETEVDTEDASEVSEARECRIVTQEEIAQEDEPETLAENIQIVESEQKMDEVEKDESSPEYETTSEIPDYQEINQDSEELPPSIPAQSHSKGMVLTCGILIGLIIGLVGGYFAGNAVGRYHLPDESDDYYDVTDTIAEIVENVVKSETEAKTDEKDTLAVSDVTQHITKPSIVETQNEQLSSKVDRKEVYDTITKTQFLTTLARKHYGVKNYWIFIYEANPGLGNPNNISPGTKLRIPDRSEFEETTPDATKAKAQQHLNNLAKKYNL